MNLVSEKKDKVIQCEETQESKEIIEKIRGFKTFLKNIWIRAERN